MASIHSSAGITLVHPASAMSAEIKALPAPIAFLLTQGTSTKPAIGSQTRPSKLDIAIDIACALCSALPPAASTAAAAPMADALPTSAWQPPVAPAISEIGRASCRERVEAEVVGVVAKAIEHTDTD